MKSCYKATTITIHQTRKIEMPYMHKDSLVEAAFQEMTRIGKESEFKFDLLNDPAYRKATVSYYAELERIGELYPHNVEIIYPPQIKEKYGKDGLIIDIRWILQKLADECEDEDRVSAERLRATADEFYPDDDLEEDDEDNDDNFEDTDLDAMVQHLIEKPVRTPFQ